MEITFFFSEAIGTETPTSAEVFTEGPSDIAAQVTEQCSAGSHNCSSNGTCIPMEGSYDCACNRGFEGDGRICDGMPYFLFFKKLNFCFY